MISRLPERVFIRSACNNASHSRLRLTARRPASLVRPCSSSRHLSTFPLSTVSVKRSIGNREPCASLYVASEIQKYSYSTANQPRQIAILGGGITGLTAAHYLARYAENAHITIYEASDKAGGWIKGERVEVEDAEGNKGHVWFQHGPRVLRSGSTSTKYDDLVLYDVLATLGLEHKIRHPQSVSDNRYLYYPDHLVKLPSGKLDIGSIAHTIRSFLTEPVWSGALWSGLNFLVNLNKRPEPINLNEKKDETVEQFLARIMKDDRMVKNLVSGMMHGIYGGDVKKLSAKHTILDQLWYKLRRELPGRNFSWVHAKEGYLLNDMLSGPQRMKVIKLAETAIDWKLLAFEDGLLSLVDGLVKDLNSKKNVTFKHNEPVTSVKYENGKIAVTTNKSKQPQVYDHVISTLFSKQLARITEPANSLPRLAETHAITMMVVNLWYPRTDILAEGGFGYLVPSSTPNNDEGVLGVLFDSDLRSGDNDSSEMPGTKLTVMLGGHHWDYLKTFPSEEEGIAMAKAVLERQLGISQSEKVVARATLCRECLPQHFLGHRERMDEAHYEIMSTFKGRLTVAGPSYTTVGVIPAMRAGYSAGMRVARGHAQPWFRIPGRKALTGVEDDAYEAYEDSEGNLVSEFDYWHQDLQEAQKGGAEISDIVGASGLEQFTENEWTDMRATPRHDLPFRKFTGRIHRYTDVHGNFLEADQRPIRNAPPPLPGAALRQNTMSE